MEVYEKNDTNFMVYNFKSGININREYKRMSNGIYVRCYGNFDVNDIFVSLPESLKSYCTSMIFEKDLEKVPLYKEAIEEFISSY